MTLDTWSLSREQGLTTYVLARQVAIIQPVHNSQAPQAQEN
jgi:hypothetical protein